MGLEMKISQILFARILLFFGMIMFMGALLRNPLISGFSEILKLPIFVAAVAFLLYIKPVVRVGLGSMAIWGFLFLVVTSSVYNSLDSPSFVADVSVFIAISVYFQVINNLSSAESFFEPLLHWFSIGVVITSFVFLFFPESFIGGRFAAGFINTNVESGFLAISVVVLSYTVFFGDYRAAHLVLLCVAVYLLLLTKGRGGMVAAFLPVAVMFLSGWRQRSMRGSAVRIIGAIIVLIFGMKIDISESTDATELGILKFRAFELGARELIVEQHLTAFWHSPLVGVGAVIEKANPLGRATGESSYTDLLALSGIFGVLIIGFLIIRALWIHWYRTESRLGFYVLLAALLLSVSEGYLVSIASAVSIILWTLLAFSPSRSSFK